MSSSLIAIIVLVIFFIAYKTYSRFIAFKLFDLEELDKKNIPTPAQKFEDQVDYVPTKKSVLFGHHFSSIAGVAPIVGPAIAIIWGVVPALLWIVFGVIFMGACHDLGALVVSMKYKGQSIAYACKDLLGQKTYILFLLVIFFLVWMIIAVFALIIAQLFINYPSTVLPVNFEILVALAIGFFINKRKKGLLIPSILAQIALLITIYLGTLYPISLEPIFGQNQAMAWIIFLMIYSFIASSMPVWMLLQPRDYINSHQLMVAMFLIITGLLITNPKIVAPAFNFTPPADTPFWFPFLFITIACGAISGFHGLVASGTTSKQIANWKDAGMIGYGSMLGEGTLALLATLAVACGFSNSIDWHNHYNSFGLANNLSAKISIFVNGSSKFIAGMGINQEYAKTILGVLIISFAATSLDTACRIQRYVISELGHMASLKFTSNRITASLIAVGSAFLLMLSAGQAKGGLLLWPLFGATNQMLAALTLTVIAFFLHKKKKNALFFIIPAIFLTLVTLSGLGFNLYAFYTSNKILLSIITIILLSVQITIIAQCILLWNKRRSA